MSKPILLINAVGMTSRLLPHAPNLQNLLKQGSLTTLQEVLPAVTSTVQATFLTGGLPQEHGIVANGWLFRDTREVRFWQQSNHLLERKPIYHTLKHQLDKMDCVGDSGMSPGSAGTTTSRKFTCAKLFWWFNQGAEVDLSVTPKPHYGCDGNKIFDIDVVPRSARSAFDQLGPFPFPSFWGPMAGLPSTRWITDCTKLVLEQGQRLLAPKADKPFDLVMVYLPHLDYDPQRFGPAGCDMPKLVGELDQCIGELVSAAKDEYRIWVVSEYGHVDVDEPVFVNRVLREAGLLEVRRGPFGETLDTFASRAFAVVDHQLAHVYVQHPDDLPIVQDTLARHVSFAAMSTGAKRAEFGLDHPRSGEIILLAKPKQWFAYPYWLNEQDAPDFAPCVDIHRKPGFDPCEMFFNEKLAAPKLSAAWRLVKKKLGFRTRFDVISTEPRIVRGSHGLAAQDPLDRPILITDLVGRPASIPMTHVHDWLLGQWMNVPKRTSGV